MKTNVVLNGDCIEELRKLEENSIDAIITDPPYGLEFMGKEWDKFKEGKRKSFVGGGGDATKKTNDAYMRINKTANRPSALTINQKLQMQFFFQEWAKECLRILKPGAFLLSFGGTRTYHRMACGIEDAGFEVRDTIMWMYGSGFPKSLNIGKQIDKIQGNNREIIGEKNRGNVKKAKERGAGYLQAHANRNNAKQFGYGKEILTKGNSEWEGWGTALKPAVEPIMVARKPLSEKNVALNVLKWGTGGINIDDCRIPYKSKEDMEIRENINRKKNILDGKIFGGGKYSQPKEEGRFPANIILDEEAGQMLDGQSGELVSGSGDKHSKTQDGKIFKGVKPISDIKIYLGDKGGASRFFYCAKASKSERNYGCENLEEKQLRKEDNSAKSLEIFSNQYTENSENTTNRGKTPLHRNNHPTVKPIKLMEYLVKLVTKENAIIVDPFLGSGTTAIACLKQNRKFIGIEKEEDYVKIAEARIKKHLEQTKII